MSIITFIIQNSLVLAVRPGLCVWAVNAEEQLEEFVEQRRREAHPGQQSTLNLLLMLQEENRSQADKLRLLQEALDFRNDSRKDAKDAKGEERPLPRTDGEFVPEEFFMMARAISVQMQLRGYKDWELGDLAERAYLHRVKAENERLYDLVRYQRHELHTAGLITNEEYADLLENGSTGPGATHQGSVARLEGYDAMRGERDAAVAYAAEIKKALTNLLETSAVITKPGADDCFVDLQIIALNYDKAYAVLEKDFPNAQEAQEGGV